MEIKLESFNLVWGFVWCITRQSFQLKYLGKDFALLSVGGRLFEVLSFVLAEARVQEELRLAGSLAEHAGLPVAGSLVGNGLGFQTSWGVTQTCLL